MGFFFVAVIVVFSRLFAHRTHTQDGWIVQWQTMMMGSVACVYNNFKMKHNNMMWHHNIAAAAAPKILPILSSGSLQVMRNNILYNYTVAPIYLLNVSNVWCVRLHSKEYPCPSPSVDDVMRIICKIFIIYYSIDLDNSSYMCSVCVCTCMFGVFVMHWWPH